MQPWTTAEYHRLLIQERAAIERLIKTRPLHISIWPRRRYEDAFMQVRHIKIKSLTDNAQYETVRVALGPCEGGNRYIFDRILVITTGPLLASRGIR